MSPVSSSPQTKLPTPMTSAGGATPFVMADRDDAPPSPLKRDPKAGPDCTMPVDDVQPVSANELLAALDRAARTSIAPAAASTDAASDVADKASDDATPQTMMTAPAPTPVVQAPWLANPFAAMLAATPVVAQAIVAADPKADDSVKAAKLADLTTASAPPTPSASPTDLPTFTLPIAPEPTAKPKAEPVVGVTVSLSTDTDLDNTTTPTFSFPTATSHHQSVSGLATQTALPTDAVNRHLDLARGDAWLDNLAKDIAASAGTGDRLRFGLSPEHLGRLDVEVSRHDTGVAVHMTTRTEEARSIIAAAQPRLMEELRANGTRIVAADVTSQMNTQTNGQSGGSPKPQSANFIEAAIDFGTPVASASTETPTTASGRYA